jgi:hypothetical protein
MKAGGRLHIPTSSSPRIELGGQDIDLALEPAKA